MKRRLLTILPLLGLLLASTPAAVSATDPAICGGKVAVYLYDLNGFFTNGVGKTLCGNANNVIAVPDLAAVSNVNNKASSLKTRNMIIFVTTKIVRVYTGVNYTGSYLTITGNKDYPRLSDYPGMNDSISSVKTL